MCRGVVHGYPRGGDDRNQPPEKNVYAGAPLPYDHWYDMPLHVIWSHEASKGLVQWWLDGEEKYSQYIANLWRRPDGSIDRPNFEFSNYRLHFNESSRVYYSKAKVGPSKGDVAF